VVTAIIAILSFASAAAAAAPWTIVPTPNPGSANSINGLVAFSPSEIWGIGNATSSSYTGCHGRTLTSRWNGTAFVDVAATPSSMCAAINGVAGPTTSGIWAVGSTNNALIEHWDGQSWSLVPAATSAAGSTLRSIAAVGSSDIWAVGSGGSSGNAALATLIEHWNGTSWTIVAAPNIGAR
jgi:hypothetical protein